MKGFFEGWYYKHQVKGRTLALIPGRSGKEAFIQIITDQGSHWADYPFDEYKKGKALRIGNSTFSSHGIRLDIQERGLSLSGEILYGGFSPIKGDIMGPFQHFPMECRHGVLSMHHDLAGAVLLNGETIDFTDGIGYIESDSGRSFPEKYLWLQCNDFARDCSIMVSVARIPFYGLRFWGCICVVWLKGVEYRLATYKGVKILRLGPHVIELSQGKYRLRIEVDLQQGHALAAPQEGSMVRTIRESAACPAKFRFTVGGRLLFAGESGQASYEYDM